MSDDKENKTAGAIASIVSALHPDARSAISGLLVFLAFFGVMYALTNMPAYFKNLVAASAPKESCWELREVQESLFKFNKCSGEAVQIEVKRPAIASPSSPISAKEGG